MTAPLPLFDHHAHLDDPDVTEAHVRSGLALPQFVGGIHAGYAPERDRLAQERIALDSRLFRTVGLHPWWLAAQPEMDRVAHWETAWGQLEASLATLKSNASNTSHRIVALGEIGLDHGLRKRLPLAQQQAHFRRGLDLARQHELPVVLHLVRWLGHALDTLRDQPVQGGVVHRYGGPPELVADFQRLGLALSLHPSRWQRDPTGFAEVVRAIDPHHLLVETDWPQRTHDWSEALVDMGAMIGAIAEILERDAHELAAELVRNATRIYRLTR